MIFPIRNEEGATRQLPIVTWSLIAVCALTFAVTDIAPEEEVVTPQRSLAEAAAYWRERGYLDATAEVLAEVGRDVDPAQREAYVERMRTRAVDWRPKDEAQLALEQTELRRLTQQGIGEVVPVVARENPLFSFGLVAANTRASTFLTHPFFHGGWVHLLGNLLLLAMFAPALENRWGRGLYGLGIVATALTGAAAHYAFAAPADQALPLVGTSAIVAGLLGAFLVRLWSADIHYYYFFGGERSGTFDSPAWLMLPFAIFIGGIQLVFANVTTAPVLISEIGGVAVAIPMALLLWQLGLEDDFAGGSSRSVVAAQRSGEEAPQIDAAELLALIEDYSGRNELESASRNWIELTRRFPAVRVAAPTLLRIAASLVKRGHSRPAALAFRHALDPANEGLSSGMALRILDEQRNQDPAIALLAAERALEIGQMKDAKRDRLQSTISELRAIVEAGGELPEDSEPPIARTASSRVPSSQSPSPSASASASARSDAAARVSSAVSTGVAPEVAPRAQRPAVVEDAGMRALTSIPLYPDLKIVEAIPLALDEASLRMQTGEGQQVALALDKIAAVGSAIVAGIGPRPVLLIDLMLGWGTPGDEPLRCVRIHSDRFDPRSFTPGVTNPVAAIRLLLEKIIDSSGAVGLPDPGSAAGRPFAEFDELAAYEREVLHVDR